MALKTWSSLALALIVVVVLGACGGSDSPSSGSATAASTPSAAPAGGDPATAAPAPPAARETSPRTTATQRERSRPSTREPAPSAPPPADAQTTPPATTPAPAPAPTPPPATTTPRAPEPRAKRQARPEPAGTPIDQLAVMRLVHRASPREYTQEGTVTGTFDGTMRLQATITNRGVVVEFVATVDGGTIEGRGITRPIITGSPLADIEGTMAIVGGSGRFAAIRGRRLAVSGKARLDGTYARVRLAGTVTY